MRTVQKKNKKNRNKYETEKINARQNNSDSNNIAVVTSNATDKQE